MNKIKCPKCGLIVFEADGVNIQIRLPRPNEVIILPYQTGPYLHGSCQGYFHLEKKEDIFSDLPIGVLTRITQSAIVQVQAIHTISGVRNLS